MPLTLHDQIALVTGGARGLGAALCEALCEAGAKVAVADLRTDLVNEVAGGLSERGFDTLAQTMDVSSEADADACVNAVLQRFGRIDILINNAGIDCTLPVDELTVDQWDQIVATNLRGPFLLSRRVLPGMKKRRSGHIVNICPTAAKRAWPNASAYHASKWGLLGFSHALHAELRGEGIKVTAMIAGGMRTPFLMDRFPDLDPAHLQAPTVVAETIIQVLSLPGASVVPEIMVLPMGETSWP
ncbi:MAG TPA: SDR family oxidoreductase [Rhodocyclaceae bacterium]|nr:SDR family oxidoreductase [Rhodocyclaceae bacterium]